MTTTVDKNEKQRLDLGHLEEDDEFEEFPTENWNNKDEDDEEVDVWEDNWDDDNPEEDFSVQLREELQKVASLKRDAPAKASSTESKKCKEQKELRKRSWKSQNSKTSNEESHKELYQEPEN